MDREKVIKGSQNLRDAIATDFIHEADQAAGTIDDALAMLKEQEKKEIKLHKKHVITWKRDDEFTMMKL